MQDTWVQSLDWEDPLEKEMATYSSTLAWRIPRTDEPGGLQSMGLQQVGHNWVINSFTFTTEILEITKLLTSACFSDKVNKMKVSNIHTQRTVDKEMDLRINALIN